MKRHHFLPISLFLWPGITFAWPSTLTHSLQNAMNEHQGADMDQKQILHQIKTTDTADIDPNAVAEIYALAISSIESSITEVDLQRLILLGAAMYRNSVKEARVSLQFPGSLTHDDADIDDDPKGGFLH